MQDKYLRKNDLRRSSTFRHPQYFSKKTHVPFTSRLARSGLSSISVRVGKYTKKMRELFCRPGSRFSIYLFPDLRTWGHVPLTLSAVNSTNVKKFFKRFGHFLFPFGVQGAEESGLNYQSLLIIASLHGSLGLIIRSEPAEEAFIRVSNLKFPVLLSNTVPVIFYVNISFIVLFQFHSYRM
ncbi:hypothetical protein CEXT_633441 [Caerostris extrusa]|uniref:Uncharacterized protein n=1 Tax=Caerostris extrusa TaxID=172846 RepID=A0AAV4P2J5_CAEEX|nr:hypothetical protein CEXT_633441 [Caerostris extrusa]